MIRKTEIVSLIKIHCTPTKYLVLWMKPILRNSLLLLDAKVKVNVRI